MTRAKISIAISLAPALLVIAACGTSPLPEIKTPMPESFPGDAWNKMHLNAANDMQCPVGKLQTKQIESREEPAFTRTAFEVTGCDKTSIFVATVGGLGGWVLVSDWDMRKKVAFSHGDKCPDWTVEYIDAGTRGVTACDQKLVYVFSNSGWVANTVTDKDGKTE